MNKHTPTISVVVPAYNEERYIRKCLTALVNQTIRIPYTIVVVDNNSTDDTRTIAKSFKRVTVKTEKRKGYVFAVKSGVEKYTTSDIIALTDADTQVDPTWLNAIYNAFMNDPDLIVSGGPFFYNEGPWLLKLFVNTVNYISPVIMNSYLCGSNMAYRRSAYSAVGGYDTKVNLGADVILSMKLQKYGKMKIFRNQIVFTSPRRYATLNRLLPEAYIQISNFLSLRFRQKPLHHTYNDIRV